MDTNSLPEWIASGKPGVGDLKTVRTKQRPMRYLRGPRPKTPKTTPGVISDESDVDGLVLLDHVERDDDRVPASALPDLRAVRDRSDPSLPRAGPRVL